MSDARDHVIREMSDDGSFRVIAARTTDTVAGIVAAQRVSGTTAEQLGDVATASVLVRETMAPGNRVQVVYRDRLGSQLVGDAHPEGRTRGLARVVDEVLGVCTGEGCFLQVARIVRGRQHEGVVATDEDAGLSKTLEHYFQQSEQVMSAVGLGCKVDGDRVEVAGGFVVQLLPEVTEPPLQELTKRLESLGDLSDHIVRRGADPARLIADVLGEFEHTRLSDAEVSFSCHCDEQRAIGAVAALGESELRDLLARGEVLPVSCDYCRTDYRIGPEAIRKILGAR